MTFGALGKLRSVRFFVRQPGSIRTLVLWNCRRTENVLFITLGMRAMIYVALLGEATPLWRAVPAEEVAQGEFVLGGGIPEGERWEFQPGTRVRCVERTFSDGSCGLVAVERLPD